MLDGLNAHARRERAGSGPTAGEEPARRSTATRSALPWQSAEDSWEGLKEGARACGAAAPLERAAPEKRNSGVGAQAFAPPPPPLPPVCTPRRGPLGVSD